MTDSALPPLRVLDLSDGVAGQFAARILAEHGAQVLLVEPPGGCGTRRRGPFGPSPATARESLLFTHLNTGKQAICVDAASEAGARTLETLAANADVIVGERDGVLATRELGSAGTVVCRIAEFAAGGPYEKWRGSEMIHQALSALMYTTGRKDDRPLHGFGHRAYYSAGAAAAIAILAALMSREDSGRGGTIDISVHETAVSMSQNSVAQVAYNGTYPVRGRYPGACDIFRCADGWATFYCRGDRWKAWCAALGAVEAAEDPTLVGSDAIVSNWDHAYRLLAPHAAKLTVADFVDRTHGARALAARIYSLEDILACDHLARRRFWESVETDEGARRILGPLFRMHGTPRRVAGAAPRLAREAAHG